jgi:hypothetical protein
VNSFFQKVRSIWLIYYLFLSLVSLMLVGCIYRYTEDQLPEEEWVVEDCISPIDNPSVFTLNFVENTIFEMGYYSDFNCTEGLDFSTLVSLPSHEIYLLSRTKDALQFSVNPPLDPNEQTINLDTEKVFYQYNPGIVGGYVSAKCHIITPSSAIYNFPVRK